MRFKSIAQLSHDVTQWQESLPRNIGLVVGIPRSGLLPALLIGLTRNLPVTDVDGLVEGRLLAAGRRLTAESPFADNSGKILVLDDSVSSGQQMRVVRERLERTPHKSRFIFAAVYVTPECVSVVDEYYEILGRERCFQWNVMHHEILEQSCVDIDGVLCRDPTPEENDDGPKYRRFIAGVPPRFVPTREIGWLVTCRLEKFREPTEAWLHRHGIRFRKLVMLDLPDGAARRRWGRYAEFKADVYTRVPARLFIESSPPQAATIARRAGKPVLCTGDWRMYNPGVVAASARLSREFGSEFLRSPSAALGKTSRYVAARTSDLGLWVAARFAEWRRRRGTR